MLLICCLWTMQTVRQECTAHLLCQHLRRNDVKKKRKNLLQFSQTHDDEWHPETIQRHDITHMLLISQMLFCSVFFFHFSSITSFFFFFQVLNLFSFHCVVKYLKLSHLLVFFFFSLGFLFFHESYYSISEERARQKLR